MRMETLKSAARSAVKSGLSGVLAVQLAMGGLTGSVASAASPVIGTVRANGAFRLNQATVAGNATLFEGATIETLQAASALQWSSGAKLTLGSDSKGRFFGDHMILERGQGQLDNVQGFHVEAGGLRIQPEAGNATGRVSIADVNRVQVAALTGSFRILNSNGLLVAKLAAGSALAFEPQAVATKIRVAGRLDVRAGHYLITDETTRVTVEVVGKGATNDDSSNGLPAKVLENAAGHRVDVTGSTDVSRSPVNEASHILRASKLTLLAQAGGAAAAGTTGGSASGSTAAGSAAGSTGASAGASGAAGGTAAAGTAGGVGAAAGAATGLVTTIAIVGGVAVAATVGGLVASGTIGGSDTPAVQSRQ